MEKVRPVHVTYRQHDPFAQVMSLPCTAASGEQEALDVWLDAKYRLERIDPQVELLDNGAQVSQVILSGNALLVIVLYWHPRQGQPLGRAEEVRIPGPPGQRMPDLLRIELDIRHALSL
jgi:hypothetical protein